MPPRMASHSMMRPCRSTLLAPRARCRRGGRCSTPQQVARLAASGRPQLHRVSCKHQLEWFKRQLFGQQERALAPHRAADAQQMHLGEVIDQGPATAAPEAARRCPHTRAPHEARSDFSRRSRARRSSTRREVPVETIEVRQPAKPPGSSPEQYEVIGHKVSHRLAQRPGSYVVLKYVRPVIKRARATQTLHCPAAPVGVIEGSRADVSFVAGVLVDKFAWHLPLYRQHQRLVDCGLQAQPAVADAARAARRAAARADLRGAVRLDPRQPRQGDGRDADQGWARRAGQDEGRLLLAGVRRARRGVLPVLRSRAGTSTCSRRWG